MNLLTVTATLRVPVAGASPLPLDSLAVAAASGRHPDAPTRTGRLPKLPANPGIGSIQIDGRRVFLASVQLASTIPARTATVGRLSNSEAETLHRSHNRKTGPTRDTMRPVPLRLAPTLRWVCWGNRRRLLEHLSRIVSVGASRGAGYGRVTEWTVTSIDGNPLDALFGDGRTLRPLPVSWVVSDTAAVSLPVTPPYWHPHNRVDAVAAGTPAEPAEALTAAVVDPRQRC